MRARISVVVAATMLVGCSSGTRTVYVVRDRPVQAPPPAAAPAPAPAPPAVVVQPLEIAVGRPSPRAVPVQTNRAAYVAVFEIIPQQGVVLVHPSTPKQAKMMQSGLGSIPVWWATPAPAGRGAARPAQPTRYIYALASERPLRMLDSAMVPGYLKRVLGPAAFRAASPQPAVRALSRHFALTGMNSKWAEDLYTLAPTQESSPRRVARIYCTGGTVYEVPEDIADRAWCPVPAAPTQPTASPAAPAQPDSVVSSNGQHVNRRGNNGVGRGLGPRERDGSPGNSQPNGHPATPAPVITPGPSTPPGAPYDRGAKDKADKDEADKDKADKDKADKDRADKDRADKDKADKQARDQQDRVEAERVERERGERERVERERVEKDHAEKEHAAKAAREKADKEKADKEKADKEKADKEKADRDATEQATAARERAEAEQARVEKEKAENEKAEKEKAEKEKSDKEKAEKESADKANAEKAEKEKADKEKAEKEKAANEKADKDKADKEKAGKPGKGNPPETADAPAGNGADSAAASTDKSKGKGRKPAPPRTTPPMR